MVFIFIHVEDQMFFKHRERNHYLIKACRGFFSLFWHII